MRVACWQAGQRPDGPAPVRRFGDVAARAADAGAALLITPEMSATGYQLGPARTAALAEPADGPLRDAMGRLATATGLAIVYGWPETADGVVHNAVHLIGADGEVAAHYRKTHLYGEFDTATFRAGDQPVVQAVIQAAQPDSDLRVGLLICYDVEFPELVRMHALAGTQLLAVPTALRRPWDFVSHTLVPTRAFESQLFIAYVNWTGPQADGYCGLSRVVGPDGRTLAAADPTGETLLVTDLDLADLAAARHATTYLQDRRPDLYHPVAGAS
ncbi:carbon-nitrogen hydrolase family protein [Parafrankia sp. FMc2]|uniref:carbon-nitrogen hydrolase family protein n=1 Tax=Parafrankia sp. FMc2 TaxID=3233196 RepID=UPI0034D6B268